MSSATGKRIIGKLYQYQGHSRWTRLHAIAAAAGVEFEHVQGFSIAKAMSDKEFLTKFPGGTCPAFESMDGKVCLTEASAIGDYIASTNPESGLMPTDPGDAAQVRMWMFICEAEFIAPLTTINRAHVGMYPWSQGMIDGVLATVHRRMANVNNYVASHKYLVGSNLTLADLTLASALGHGYAKFFDAEWRDKYPDSFAYFQRIIKEPRVAEVFGEPELMEKTPEPKQK